MTQSERIKRPEPERDEPIRNPWASDAAGPTDPPGSEAGVDEVIAHAVRLGYRVIGDNIEQGRAAAGRFSQGDYGVEDVPDDLGELAARLLHLGREMSVTAFDVMGAILRDPGLRTAFGRRSQARAGSGGSTGFDAHKPAAKPSRPGASSSDRAKRDLRLTYAFAGGGRADAEPAWLRQPDEMAMPVHAGLHSPAPDAPPLRGITFSVAPDGLGVVARIDIPDGQPPGVYSGAVCDSKSHHVLGVMTITVLR